MVQVPIHVLADLPCWVNWDPLLCCIITDLLWPCVLLLQRAWVPLVPPWPMASSPAAARGHTRAMCALVSVPQGSVVTPQCPASWTPTHPAARAGSSLPVAPAPKEVRVGP